MCIYIYIYVLLILAIIVIITNPMYLDMGFRSSIRNYEE